MILNILLCMVVTLVLQLLTPIWWWAMVIPAGCMLLRESVIKRGFLTGALSIGLLWLFAGIYFYATGAEHVVVRVAMISGLESPLIVFAETFIIAGAAGGCGGALGSLIRHSFIQAASVQDGVMPTESNPAGE